MINKKINLIPTEMAVPTRALNLAATLNKISVFGAVAVILAALSLIAGLVYYNLQYKKSASNVESLKNKIVQLQKNEQKLILAKDKLSKISYIRSLDSVDAELTNYKAFQNLVMADSNSNISEVSIGPNKIETTVTLKDTLALTNVLSTITTLPNYKKIVLSSLAYSSATGYLINLVFNQ